MFPNFFQIGPVIGHQLTGVYDAKLVILSYLVAVFASYIALDFAGRLRDPRNSSVSRLFWLLGGAIAMGAGIWSMHFIGMLSFSMPEMTMSYDLFWTSLSLFVAVIASGFALFLLQSKVINTTHLIIGGVILGFAIASMHYTGMEAMSFNMNIRYVPSIFILSIVIAISASEAALWLAIKSNQAILKLRARLKLISAAIMGLGICGMHYTGMFAAIFTPKHNMDMMLNPIDPTILSTTIAVITFVILGIAFFASTYKESINQQQVEVARQLGMAEVSANILHNVGNVLNSLNVSANLMAEKVQQSKFDELGNLCSLLNDHKSDLAAFITIDPRGNKIPDFLNLLSHQLHDELNFITTETSSLVKNIEHIKNIISVQQGLSKITSDESINSVDDIIEESLLISGLTDNAAKLDVTVQKNCEHLKPILIDKVKLLQILVNILTNAKDALKDSPNKNERLITLKTAIVNNNKIKIEITDNGVGISPDNLNKIFIYGFTTKKTGHGFGMNASAQTASELGGIISAYSAGKGKGATFTVELPYTIPAK